MDSPTPPYVSVAQLDEHHPTKVTDVGSTPIRHANGLTLLGPVL